jgi:hypothetical protein
MRGRRWRGGALRRERAAPRVIPLKQLPRGRLRPRALLERRGAPVPLHAQHHRTIAIFIYLFIQARTRTSYAARAQVFGCTVEGNGWHGVAGVSGGRLLARPATIRPLYPLTPSLSALRIPRAKPAAPADIA